MHATLRCRSTGVLVALALVVAGCETGTTGSSVPDGSPTGAAATPSTLPTGRPTAVPTPARAPEATPVATEYSPPAPDCPAPDGPVQAPALVASLDGVAVPMTMGSDSVTTCSTSGSFDRVPAEPSIPLTAASGDVIRLSLPAGWRFLYWQGWDHPVEGDAGNVIVGRETPDRPSAIDAPAPFRPGDSVLTVWAYVVREDGRAISQISGSVLVRLPGS